MIFAFNTKVSNFFNNVTKPIHLEKCDLKLVHQLTKKYFHVLSFFQVCVLQKLADSTLKNIQDKDGVPNPSKIIREETIQNSENAEELEPNGVTENGSNGRETDSKNDNTNSKIPNANKSDKTIEFHTNESLNSNEVHKNKSDENPNEVHESEPGTKHEIREDDSEKMDEVHEIDFQAGKNTGGKSEVNMFKIVLM